MIGSDVLLDTNIISAWLKGDISVANNIDRSNKVYIPIVVIGELHYGAQFSIHIKENTKNIQKLINQYNTLFLDHDTVICYGAIKVALRKKGKPIPENDIWISAIAMQHDLTIITRDKHFQEVEGLKIACW